ncbi:hypothetical protein PMIN05_012257 [Paraphaeosphaeria minitans]
MARLGASESHLWGLLQPSIHCLPGAVSCHAIMMIMRLQPVCSHALANLPSPTPTANASPTYLGYPAAPSREAHGEQTQITSKLPASHALAQAIKPPEIFIRERLVRSRLAAVRPSAREGHASKTQGPQPDAHPRVSPIHHMHKRLLDPAAYLHKCTPDSFPVQPHPGLESVARDLLVPCCAGRAAPLARGEAEADAGLHLDRAVLLACLLLVACCLLLVACCLLLVACCLLLVACCLLLVASGGGGPRSGRGRAGRGRLVGWWGMSKARHSLDECLA